MLVYLEKIIPVISKHLCTIVSPFIINCYNKNVIMEIFKKSLKFQSTNITGFTVTKTHFAPYIPVYKISRYLSYSC